VFFSLEREAASSRFSVVSSEFLSFSLVVLRFFVVLVVGVSRSARLFFFGGGIVFNRVRAGTGPVFRDLFFFASRRAFSPRFPFSLDVDVDMVVVNRAGLLGRYFSSLFALGGDCTFSFPLFLFCFFPHHSQVDVQAFDDGKTPPPTVSPFLRGWPASSGSCLPS